MLLLQDGNNEAGKEPFITDTVLQPQRGQRHGVRVWGDAGPCSSGLSCHENCWWHRGEPAATSHPSPIPPRWKEAELQRGKLLRAWKEG